MRKYSLGNRANGRGYHALFNCGVSRLFRPEADNRGYGTGEKIGSLGIRFVSTRLSREINGCFRLIAIVCVFYKQNHVPTLALRNREP